MNELQRIELPSLKMPFWRYFELFRDCRYAFLLDSALESERLGKFSFLGGDPFLVFRAKRTTELNENTQCTLADCSTIEFVDPQGQRHPTPRVATKRGDPIAVLREIFATYRPDFDSSNFDIPFTSGAVGYFGYEAGHFFEKLPSEAEDDLGLPDIYLMFFRQMLAYVHESQKAFFFHRGTHNDAERASEEILRKMKAIESAEPFGPHPRPLSFREKEDSLEVRSHFNEISYGRAVRNVKDCIAAGEVYQVCLTHRLESPLENASAWALYRALREINPAPFAGFLQFPEVEVVSSSPERFLKLDRDRLAESRPIKGTRPRGKTPAEDDRLRNELLASAKDRAENVMIVDLVRNDFGRVCRYGSVRVRDFLAVEPYATVFQMVSTVEGRLAEEFDRFDLIRACFPGGSMTGAPKIEAMKIIDRLEPVERGIYSGAIGYLDFSGAMDLGMVIRTILVKDGQCYYHVGGGIVADSDPQAEYVETQDKARALIKAIGSLNPR